MNEALADDNCLTQDRFDQKKIVDVFNAMRDRLHEWKPDLLLVIDYDQAENYQPDNLLLFCLYRGSEVDGYPFNHLGGSGNSWNVAAETKFSFSCPQEFSRDLRNALIPTLNWHLGWLPSGDRPGLN